jgi:hypothetical protein
MYTTGVTMGPLISGCWRYPWDGLVFSFRPFPSIGFFTGSPAGRRETHKTGKFSDALACKRSYSHHNVRYLSFAAFSLF